MSFFQRLFSTLLYIIYVDGTTGSVLVRGVPNLKVLNRGIPLCDFFLFYFFRCLSVPDARLMTFAIRPTVPTPIFLTVFLMEKSVSVLPFSGLPLSGLSSSTLSREDSNSPAFSSSPSSSSSSLISMSLYK